MQEIIAFANSLADKSGEIVQKYFRTDFTVESKSDHSPVTIADKEVEQTLREMIEATYPQDGILGEEFGRKESQSGRMWVIDPIDGTKSFMIGRPTFGTLIALCEGDIPKIGVIDQPIMKERWVGDCTQTTMNGKPVKTRPCKDIHEARIGSTTPMMFDDLSDFGRAYHIFEKPPRMAWGGDCYMYGLIASGWMDIAFEQNLSAYDFAALVPIIKGAGGHISDWRGDELTLNSAGKVIAIGDPDLWPDVDRMIRRSPF